jgi:hypothetical protein
MADIDFVIWLSDKDWILVIIKTLKNKVLSYIVKYNALIEIYRERFERWLNEKK